MGLEREWVSIYVSKVAADIGEYTKMESFFFSEHSMENVAPVTQDKHAKRVCAKTNENLPCGFPLFFSFPILFLSLSLDSLQDTKAN